MNIAQKHVPDGQSFFTQVATSRVQFDEVEPLDSRLERLLVENRTSFLSYLLKRLGDRDEAEDVLQDFCIRVIRKSGQIRDGAAAEGWLRAVLKSTLMDHFRSKSSKRQAHQKFVSEWSATSDQLDPTIDEGREIQNNYCACLYGLLPKLKSDYAEALSLVDLAERAPTDVAHDLGIAAGTMRVRLHRARHALKRALEQSCGGCRENGCSAPATAQGQYVDCQTAE